VIREGKKWQEKLEREKMVVKRRNNQERRMKT
jgi:hypothetical protein